MQSDMMNANIGSPDAIRLGTVVPEKKKGCLFLAHDKSYDTMLCKFLDQAWLFGAKTSVGDPGLQGQKDTR